MSDRPNVVLPKALSLPVFKKLSGRRVILASASPRRKVCMETYGFRPEIIPSKFAEDLPKMQFEGRLAEYPISTAGEKAMEVYERLVKENDRDPPDLVISADTVVIFPPESHTRDGGEAQGEVSEILEKPISRHEQFKTLQLMSGRQCEIVTGVTIVYPCVEAPGFKLESMSCSTLCQFHDNSDETIQAYVDSEEGLDRAGGFAIQELGGILMDKVMGDYDNVVGFPSAPFWRWLGTLNEAGVFDDAWTA